MPAHAFAQLSRHAPGVATVAHPAAAGGVMLQISYTCHLAAMHWALMDLGDADADATAKLSAVSRAQCQTCGGHGGMGGHPGLGNAWYGARFCGGAIAIPNRAALHGAVEVGDVLIVRNNNVVTHSMIVVRKSVVGPHTVHVRGFNNFQTLGTGLGNQYDDHDRDIDRGQYWHPAGFGTGHNGAVSVVRYALYSSRAAYVRNNCLFGPGGWTYNGL